MNGTYVRGLGGVSQVPDLTGLNRQERIRALKSTLLAMDGTVGRARPVSPYRAAMMTAIEQGAVIAVPDGLSGFLPGGGLPRQAVTTVGDCPALVVEILAAATRAGAAVAVVGWPDLILTGVVDAGGDLDRVVVIPDPGDRPLVVTGMLVEGMDLVVHYSREPMRIGAGGSRILLSKVRRGAAALVTVGFQLSSSTLCISADVVAYHGIEAGGGRIRAVDLDVCISAGGASVRRTRLRIGRIPSVANTVAGEILRVDDLPLESSGLRRTVRVG
ncbi:hypothetical protein [Corynebacterium sp. CCM 9204]|uniref:hypothetical protein n=1 Tax=Corynebacterium sp. CCM 9204 TaxID=3057616 RepID=UPI0035238F6B